MYRHTTKNFYNLSIGSWVLRKTIFDYLFSSTPIVKKHSLGITSVQVLPHSRSVLSSDDNGKLVLFNLQKHSQCVETIEAHSRAINKLQIHFGVLFNEEL